MAENSTSRTDIGLAAFLVIGLGLILIEAAGLPPGVYEPLGSGPIPIAVAGLALFLTVWIGVRAVRNPMANSDGEETVAHPSNGVRAAGVIGLTALYILAMQLGIAGFAIATCLFLLLAIGLMVRFAARPMIVAAVLSLIVGFGGEWLFTTVLIVDLPN